MDDGGPCGLLTITNSLAEPRCTSDEAVCLLDVERENNICTTGIDIRCEKLGRDFVPFCSGDMLVWKCLDEKNGTGQPFIEDCATLGGGTCDPATGEKCIKMQVGGRCSENWLCDDGLVCVDKVCSATATSSSK